MDSRYKLVIENIFIDKLADIKMNKDVSLFFILFLSDGYCIFDPRKLGLDKEMAISVFHDMVQKIKPEAYCTCSDAFMRSFDYEIKGEQLMAITIGKDGEQEIISREYVRENGNIRFVDSTLPIDELSVSGRMTSFFAEMATPIFENDRAMMEGHLRFVGATKKSYQNPANIAH